MKTRENLRRMRAADLGHLIELASDAMPGTVFDTDIKSLTEAIANIGDGTCQRVLFEFGAITAMAVAERNSDFFRKFADAIDEFRSHKPHPDKLRLAVVRHYLSSRIKGIAHVTARDLVAELSGKGLGNPEKKDLQRTVRRICKELRIPIKGTPGRPRKTMIRTP